MGSVGWEMAGDTLSRLYISLAFPFFLLFSGFHLDGSLDSVPPSAVLETSSLFLFPFSPTPQTMVREARRFLAAGGAFVSRSHTCFSSGLFHKNTPSSLGLGGRSGIDFRGCIPFLVFIFRSYGTLDVGVFLVYPHSIRYPPGLYLDQVARQYENCFFLKRYPATPIADVVVVAPGQEAAVLQLARPRDQTQWRDGARPWGGSLLIRDRPWLLTHICRMLINLLSPDSQPPE